MFRRRARGDDVLLATLVEPRHALEPNLVSFALKRRVGSKTQLKMSESQTGAGNQLSFPSCLVV